MPMLLINVFLRDNVMKTGWDRAGEEHMSSSTKRPSWTTSPWTTGSRGWTCLTRPPSWACHVQGNELLGLAMRRGPESPFGSMCKSKTRRISPCSSSLPSSWRWWRSGSRSSSSVWSVSRRTSGANSRFKSKTLRAHGAWQRLSLFLLSPQDHPRHRAAHLRPRP